MNNLQTQILIADDDPVYREVASEALTKAGHAVTLVSDGAEAIAALANTAFDAGIIDLTMPKADGIAVIESARANGPNVNTPFVVITGQDDTGAVERAYRAGAKSFLTKPLNWVLFTPHINFVLRSGQIENELREATTASAFLSDLKSEMMASLAREFQQPIKTIFSCAELIRQEAFGPLTPTTYREMAMDMGGAAQRLNASFLKLMDLGNALTEQLDLKLEQFSVAETIANILTAQLDTAERRHVRIEPKIDLGPDVVIEADRVLFIQAVRAIIGNAVKFAPRGSRVEIHGRIGADGSLRIGALDSGPAVSAALLAEIKRTPNQKPTPQIDGESRDVGIKIAKILTEAHQGRLDVHADSDGANIVRLEFPAQRLKSPAAANMAASETEHSRAQRLAAISQALSQDPRVRIAQVQSHAADVRSAPNRPASALTAAQPRIPR